jgi:large subunit ribosomal protein L9
MPLLAKNAIEGTTVEISAKVSESGKLFGGISNEVIVAKRSSRRLLSRPRPFTWIPSRPPVTLPPRLLCIRKSPPSFTVKVVAE